MAKIWEQEERSVCSAAISSKVARMGRGIQSRTKSVSVVIAALSFSVSCGWLRMASLWFCSSCSRIKRSSRVRITS